MRRGPYGLGVNTGAPLTHESAISTTSPNLSQPHELQVEADVTWPLHVFLDPQIPIPVVSLGQTFMPPPVEVGVVVVFVVPDSLIAFQIWVPAAVFRHARMFCWFLSIIEVPI